MSESTAEVQAISWWQRFGCFEIFRTFRVSLVGIPLCLAALIVSFWLVVAVDQGAGTDVRMLGAPDLNLDGRVSFYENGHYIVTQTLWNGSGQGPGGFGGWSLPYVDGKTWGDFFAFLFAPVSAAKQAVQLFIAYWSLEGFPWFALVASAIALGTWAFAGGAVARMAAVRVAREETIGQWQAVRFACRKWPSLAGSPLMPFGVLILIALGVGAVTGLPMMVPYFGEIVMPLLFFLTLIMGLVMALIFVGGAFSVGLQWPTIGVEGSDAFDAISRSVAYVFGRPWRYLGYLIVLVVYGCLAFIFIKFVFFLAVWTTHGAVSWFTWGADGMADKLVRMWAEPTLNNPWPATGDEALAPAAETIRAEAFGATVIGLWVWLLAGAMISFLASFCLTGHTVIYFLLRRAVDATDIEEVYLEEEQEEEQLPVEPPASKVEPEGAVEGGDPSKSLAPKTGSAPAASQATESTRPESPPEQSQQQPGEEGEPKEGE